MRFKSSNLAQQSVELPGTRSAGATGVFRHVSHTAELVEFLPGHPELKSLYDIWQNSVKEFGPRDFLGHRPFNTVAQSYGGYTWQTYAQIDKRVNAFGSGLMHLNEKVLGNAQLNRWSLGIWSVNRPEWFLSEMSCNLYNNVSVPLYDTLGPDAVEYIINHAETPIVVASANHIASLLENAEKLPTLKAIISMDSLQDTVPVPGHTSAAKVLRAWGAQKGIRVFDFAEIENLGVEFPRKHIRPQADEVCSICYTSGTTGVPKGALLTHKAIVAALGSNAIDVGTESEDVVISFLPLAHIMGRTIDASAMASGAKLGYFRGDILLLLEDVGELRPTFFPAVPRLLNRIYAKLVASTIEAPGLVGALARRGVATKLANLAAGKGVTHPLWDRLLFNKVKQALGGRVQVILTGSAPIAKEVLSFLRIAFCCTVLEGYGSTEGIANATLTVAEEYIPGHIGCPRSSTEIKLVDVPEMNYFSTDKPYPRGEIQIRSVAMFSGYYKDEKNTKEALSEDGWLATGDIGFVDERGCFTIVDRKKNIFKLAQGEYIAPEKIENVLQARCNLIQQIYVHGESLQSTLVSIVVPEPETFAPFVSAIVGKTITMTDLAGLEAAGQDPRVRAAVLKELEKAGKAGALRGFEFVKRVYLTMDAFSVENNMMTPTFKVRRPQVKEAYTAQIQAMYEDINSAAIPAKL
ncbi:hypothetical protein DFQ26_000631 [Actinomortierella ambigua]|nr:hypothetical protein DFQ26_000631 [Actinomortierella ambigua]